MSGPSGVPRSGKDHGIDLQIVSYRKGVFHQPLALRIH
jgi:hypothetical protein